MNAQDIRWKQRFSNFCKALQQLQDGVNLSQQRKLSSLEMQGMIQAFEFTHELAWNVLRDYLTEQGIQNVIGSRDATREAFKAEIIIDGERWMEMIRSRNLSSHTYNIMTAEKLVNDIQEHYYILFIELQNEMRKRL